MLRRLWQAGLLAGVGAWVAARLWDAALSAWPAALPASGAGGRFYWAAAAVGAVAAVLALPALARSAWRGLNGVIESLDRLPAHDVAAGSFGLAAGLVLSRLISLSLPFEAPLARAYGSFLITVTVTYAAVIISVRKREGFLELVGWPRSDQGGPNAKGVRRASGATIILDTSVIIDGRVADIARTGFLEGTLVVPEFVLRELQHIADSADVLRRNRGRRGLDILKEMQREGRVTIRVVDWDADDGADVDTKLVRLAKELKGKVMSNDYNLTKVAELHGVPVLNINELANALKPAVLPGEEMCVHVIRDGKEHGQGVAYLDDGTMIVVEGGRRYIGSEVPVTVTSVLQTAAGRMIFARPNEPAVVNGGKVRAAQETG